ncbi:MAG: proline dehydrogenase family protein [Chloroflexota bacterium]|nr:proline dehydrogenase family protein [Chloroflexota bacterium]
MLRPGLIWLSKQEWAERGARAAGVERLLVRRFVAGDTRTDALALAQGLSQTTDGVLGANAKFSFLGEAVTDPAEAEQAVAEYCALAAAIGDTAELDARMGVKPTLLGLGISYQTAERGLLTIVETAAEHGVRVELDMEASDTVDATLELYRAASAKSEWTGVALQSYLRRTPDDAQALIDEGIARVRLVKGAYSEPGRVAYSGTDSIRRAYTALLEQLWRAGADVGVATHDPVLHRAARRLANDLPSIGYWEFQMLYGVRPELGSEMRSRGERLRMSIPYGERWYPYLMRRIAERPANALFALRAVVGR